jgi:hypothetical protein
MLVHHVLVLTADKTLRSQAAVYAMCGTRAAAAFRFSPLDLQRAQCETRARDPGAGRRKLLQ